MTACSRINVATVGVLFEFSGITHGIGEILQGNRPTGGMFINAIVGLLFLVGGGIGQVIFFIPAWWVATRIHRPLTWWRDKLPVSLQKGLARLWPALLALPTLGMIVALYLAVFGYLPWADQFSPRRVTGTRLLLSAKNSADNDNFHSYSADHIMRFVTTQC